MPFLNMAKTTTVAQVVMRARIDARLGNSQSELNFLGRDQNMINYVTAILLNESVSDVLRDLPMIPGMTTGTAVLNGGTGTCLLPSNLREFDLYSIRLIHACENHKPLIPITQGDWNKMPSPTRHGMPERYMIVGDTVQVTPVNSTDMEIEITYRQSQPKYSASDVALEYDDPASLILPIPDEIIDVLVTKLAQKFCERNNGNNGLSAEGLNSKYILRTNEIINNLMSSPDMLAGLTFDFQGYPPSRLSSPYDTLQSPTIPYEEIL